VNNRNYSLFVATINNQYCALCCFLNWDIDVIRNNYWYHANTSISCNHVCLSVHLSHAGIVSKRLNIETRNQHHMIAQGSVF